MAEQHEHDTDLGNARWLVKIHGANLRHCAARKTWLVWDGKRWAPDETGEAMRRAKDVPRHYMRWALEYPEGSDERRKAVNYALQCEQRHSLENMLRLGETELPMPVKLVDLDAAGNVLNVQNGTLDLQEGYLREHRRGDMLTRIAAAPYDPDVHDERWELFIKQTMPDEDVRRYVQKALGYSVLGRGTEGSIFLPYGPTHTGKTTLLEAVKSALGSYAVAMDVSTLVGNPRSMDSGRPRSDLVRLFGSRFVVSTEVPNGVKLDEALVKKLTGGDTVAARTLYQAEQETVPTFVMWLGSNYRPAVRNDDDAVWERVKQIPFAEQHAGGAKDSTLKPYLCDDPQARTAVLAWVVAGARAYLDEGLETPQAVLTLTQDYRREMNPLWAWAQESCDLGSELRSTYSQLRWSYDEFTKRGDKPIGTRRFTNSLKQLDGVTYDDVSRVYCGIAPHDGGV
jgi:putative DNA primase/helicase